MSNLPESNTPWPPRNERARYDRMRTNATWYGGDRDQLAALGGGGSVRLTGGVVTTLNPNGDVKGIEASGRDVFWGQRNNTHEVDTRRHLPVAEDIAALSAEVLFATRPQIVVDGPVETVQSEGGKAKAERPTAATKAAQQRLDRILDRCNFQQTLMAAAETSAALGAAGLRIAIDRARIPDRPVIVRVDADAIMPQYAWGQLTGVWFWQVVKADERTVWRHIESHIGGWVYHGLYRGEGDNLGERMPLESLPATAHLAAAVNEEGGIALATGGGATAVSIPNMLPDSLDRQNPAGRSDYTVSVRGLFDDIDRVHTQFIESIDDARSRLFIDESVLERGKPGEGLTFNQEQRNFTKLRMPPSDETPSGLPIEKVQFEMRVQEYLAAIDALVTKAIEAAGYTAESDNDAKGKTMTATEYSGRNQRSMRTRGKKIGYWRTELESILTTLLAVDVEHFGAFEDVDGKPVKVEAFPVRVEFPPAVQPTIIELANTAEALQRAKAASVATLVKVVHPEWDELEVQAEVDRMLAESQVIDPITFHPEGAADSQLANGMSVNDARTALDALGVGVRAGADPDEVAEVVGLGGIKMTGATPVSLRLPQAEANQMEEK